MYMLLLSSDDPVVNLHHGGGMAPGGQIPVFDLAYAVANHNVELGGNLVWESANETDANVHSTLGVREPSANERRWSIGPTPSVVRGERSYDRKYLYTEYTKYQSVRHMFRLIYFSTPNVNVGDLRQCFPPSHTKYVEIQPTNDSKRKGQ